MRLIDVEKLIWRLGVDDNDRHIIYVTSKDIDTAPTIEVTPGETPVVHGRWILHEEGAVWKKPYFKCSHCGSRNPLHKFNYCFNCGAKMDM